MLASLLYPYDDDARALIDGWLGELEAGDHIRRYEVDGSQYLEVAKWLDHQKIDKPSKSRLPEFVEGSRIVAKVREASATDLGPSTLDLVPTNASRSRSASPPSEDFENLKKVYPRRKGNFGWKAAERKFNSLVKTGVDPKAILAAARRFAIESSGKVGTEFIPMLASWLNSEDFVDAAVAAFDEAPAIDWDIACQQWKSIRRWPRGYGNDPESPACRAPPEILKKHGIQQTGV
jgi:hypothetical protein